jgi:hypothetical protein
MLIALDFDGTYTADPDMWDEFISNARMRGHKVVVATMRIAGIEDSVVEMQLRSKVDDIVYTNRKAKKVAFRTIYGENPDIWIDDNPEWLFEDAL